MGSYIKRQAEFRAAQFTGAESLKEVLAVLPLQKSATEYTLKSALNGQPTLVIEYSQNSTRYTHELNFGDWLVTDPNLDVAGMTDDEFTANFEKVRPVFKFNNELSSALRRNA